MDLRDDWRVCEAWFDASVQRLHGVYLLHVDGLQVHVIRQGGLVPGGINELQALLRQRNWTSAPYDMAVLHGESLMACALFETLTEDIVLEGFITDARQFANFAMPGPLDAVLAARSAPERLAASLCFDAR